MLSWNGGASPGTAESHGCIPHRGKGNCTSVKMEPFVLLAFFPKRTNGAFWLQGHKTAQNACRTREKQQDRSNVCTLRQRGLEENSIFVFFVVLGVDFGSLHLTVGHLKVCGKAPLRHTPSTDVEMCFEILKLCGAPRSRVF